LPYVVVLVVHLFTLHDSCTECAPRQPSASRPHPWMFLDLRGETTV
jgi:hypothetical protein